MQVSYLVSRTQDVRFCAYNVAFYSGVPFGLLSVIANPLIATFIMAPIIAFLSLKLKNSWQMCMHEVQVLPERDRSRIHCAIKKYGGEHWYWPILLRAVSGAVIGAGVVASVFALIARFG